MSRTIKELIAVFISAAGALMGLFGMLRGELGVNVNPAQVGDPNAISTMIHGLEMYCSGIGLIFLIAGIAYILVGQEEQISTILASPEDKKK